MTNEEAWNYAIGLLKVDGLEPSADFMELIEKEKRGEVTLEQLKEYLDSKYKNNSMEAFNEAIFRKNEV